MDGTSSKVKTNQKISKWIRNCEIGNQDETSYQHLTEKSLEYSEIIVKVEKDYILKTSEKLNNLNLAPKAYFPSLKWSIAN